MTNGRWLRAERASLAAEQILDAAGRLFAERGVGAVGMSDVATAAGCSRATLYRYYENRDALRYSFVDREARTIGAAVAAELTAVVDPREHLVEAMMSSLRHVRADANLAPWFTEIDSGAAVVLSRSSDVIEGLAAAFLGDRTDPEVRRRARWVVRILVSLLVDPGGDPSDERAAHRGVRRAGRRAPLTVDRERRASHPGSTTVMTSLPRARPLVRWSMAAGTSLSG